MTTTTDTKNASKDKNDKNDKHDDVMTKPANGSDEFVDYVIDRPSFQPELLTTRDDKRPKYEIYNGPAVQGLWLGYRSFGTKVDEQGRPRQLLAYIVKLTAPCKVADREGTLLDAKVGDEIMVWATAQLNQAIPPEVANHPTHVVHMRMIPVHRGPKPGDSTQRMWTLKFASSKTSPVVPRSRISGGASAVQQLLSTAPKQLAAPAGAMGSFGDGVEVGVGDTSGLPF